MEKQEEDKKIYEDVEDFVLSYVKGEEKDLVRDVNLFFVRLASQNNEKVDENKKDLSKGENL